MSSSFTPHELVRQIHSSGRKVALAATGGGSQAIGELLQVPGASRTVLEAVVPYAAKSLAQFLGAAPEHACSPRTARAMAMAAYWRAVDLSSDDASNPDTLIGLGCTASLASDRPKLGPHRVHVAAQAAGFTATASLELTKGNRSRAEEEELAARLVLNELAAACETDARLDLRLLAGEHVERLRTDAPEDWRELLLGEVDAVCLGGEEAGNEHSVAILSGAFNPLHEGHRHMAEIAAALLGAPPEFEISIENVDKPPLDYTEIAERAVQFTSEQALWLTRAATFVDKSAIFPGSVFIVGADTISRIADPRYYGDNEAACAQAIASIAERGCRFLVFGRHSGGRFESLSDLALPAKLLAICQEVPEEKFRADVSSSEIRRTRDDLTLDSQDASHA